MRRIIIAVLAAFAIIGCTQQKQLRIMSYNIHAGIGMDGKIKLERTAAVIRGIAPDFVGLQEVDSVAERTGLVDQAAELARLTDMQSFFSPAINLGSGRYGVAVLVREKPLSHKCIQLPGAEEMRTFLILEYEEYLLCNTHLSLTPESRKESIEIIYRTVREYNKAAILTGDFNFEPDSEEFRMMSANWTLLSDPTKATYSSTEPEGTIDFIWSLKAHDCKVLSNNVVDEQMASDHLPLYSDILLTD